MSRRLASLIAVAALLVPLAVAAWPACAMAEGCPMAAEHGPPCHGAAIQAADCCAPEMSATAPTEGLRAAVAIESVQLASGTLSLAAAAPAGRTTGPVASAAPLYTLHRALLI